MSQELWMISLDACVNILLSATAEKNDFYFN